MCDKDHGVIMNIPKYITNHQSYIILSNQEVINQSNAKHTHDTWVFSEDTEVVMLIDQYQDEVNIVINEDVKVNLSIIYRHFQSIHHQLNVVIHKNAMLNLYHDYQTKRNSSLTVDKKYFIKENAQLRMLNQLIYHGNIELNETVHLQEKDAYVDVEILNIGQKQDEHKVNQNINHQATHTKSQIHNWMLSLEQSKLTYFVNGSIAKGNEKSSCKQSNKGIILNHKGEIKVVPTLLIDEYDVEASHGAAIGQIDENQLFYLLSRGLNEADAKGLIVSGYVNPFIDKINNEVLSKRLKTKVNRLFRG